MARKTYTRTAQTNLERERRERKTKIVQELESIGVTEEIITQVGPVNQLAAFAQGVRWAMENFFEESEPEPQPGAIVVARDNPPALVPVYIGAEDAEALYLFREFMSNSRNAQIICELMAEEMYA